MKKLRCPKCDEFIVFDEQTIDRENTVVFHCNNCGKTFKVRFKSKEKPVEGEEEQDYGKIVVVENTFCKRQEFPLYPGDNLFGRRNPGDDIDCPIVSTDPSMDRRHCIINVSEKNGKIIYKVRDAGSNVGTFVQNDILGDREQRIINDGTVISLGATTLILKEPENCSES